MEQELLMKLIQTTEETNKTVKELVKDVAIMKQDMAQIREEQVAMKRDIKVLKDEVEYAESTKNNTILQQALLINSIELLNARIAREMEDKVGVFAKKLETTMGA